MDLCDLTAGLLIVAVWKAVKLEVCTLSRKLCGFPHFQMHNLETGTENACMQMPLVNVPFAQPHADNNNNNNVWLDGLLGMVAGFAVGSIVIVHSCCKHAKFQRIRLRLSTEAFIHQARTTKTTATTQWSILYLHSTIRSSQLAEFYKDAANAAANCWANKREGRLQAAAVLPITSSA